MSLSSSQRRKGVQTFVLPYVPIAFEERKELAPAVEARLSWGSRHWQGWMLLDTGATFSVLPSSVAEELGLKLSSRPLKRTVVGGSVPARESEVRFQLATKDRLGRPGQSLPMVPIQVTERGQDTPVPLLGRHPFLDWYEVTVRQPRKEFVLREI